MLTIAGSDSSGGAGIQADIKTAAAHGIYAMSVITAVTAQNTQGVIDVQPLSAACVARQLKAVFTDIKPDAVKIGMISSPDVAEAVAEALHTYGAANVVVDPVMVATSGHRLSSDYAVEQMVKDLFPLATLVTPNVAEAQSLAGCKIAESHEMMLAAIQILNTTGSQAVLVKGGDLNPRLKTISDVLLCRGRQPLELTHPQIQTRNTHGTGCSLSSAIACGLAKGLPLEEAVREAINWITRAITSGKNIQLGKGRGPINHMLRNAVIKEL
jgi:hydroxymethylpyrimidine/phosphomethylpyrimidine kinase